MKRTALALAILLTAPAAAYAHGRGPEKREEKHEEHRNKHHGNKHHGDRHDDDDRREGEHAARPAPAPTYQAPAPVHAGGTVPVPTQYRAPSSGSTQVPQQYRGSGNAQVPPQFGH